MNLLSLDQISKHYGETREVLKDFYKHKLRFILTNAEDMYEDYKASDVSEESFEEFLELLSKDWMIENGFNEEYLDEIFELDEVDDVGYLN